MTVRRAAHVPLAALAGVLGMAVLASPAAAHDDQAALAVTAVRPVDRSTVEYAVRVTYVNDGEGAAGATVTAVAQGPAGAAVPPVALEPGPTEGDYQGRISFPSGGAWEVRFTSVSPAATLVQPQRVAFEATTTTDPSTTQRNATTADDGGSRAPAGGRAGKDGRTGTVVFFAVLLALAVLAAIIILSARRARRRTGRAAQDGVADRAS